MILPELFEPLGLKAPLLHADLDRETSVARNVPIQYFVTPEIFSTRNGELGAVIKVSGITFEVSDADELNHAQFLLGFALQNLGDDYSVYFTTHRHLQSNELGGEYPPGFAADLYTAYSQQFKDAKLYVNDLYITLLQKSKNQAEKKFSWLPLNKKAFLARREELFRNQLKEFRTALSNFMEVLGPYHPVLLGEKKTGDAVCAEPLSFLSILINGKSRDYHYPSQSVASAVPECRLFFGHDTVHFQGLYKGSDQFAAVLSIKNYAPITRPDTLDALLAVPIEYLATHSFLSLEKNSAIKMINRQIKRMWSVGDAARTQILELENALDDVASGRISYGFHHNTLLVFSDDQQSLEEKIAKIIKIYQDQQFLVVRETMNLENAFWAQIPGNSRYIRRQAPVSSNNISCLAPLHNYYTGYIDRNHLGGALMLAETPSRTPLCLNLHEKASGNVNDLSKGHTLLIGPSNTGKTVVMTMIAAMYKKYGIRAIFLDRNLGCEIYVRAVGGIYNRLLPGESTGWNPLQLDDNEKNRKFLREWLAVLAGSKQKMLGASDYSQIAEAVERNFTLPFQKRNLSNVSSFFRLDFSGMDALSRYLRLQDQSGRPGDRAYLFDNDTDDLNLDADTLGFDMTHWLSDAGDAPEELLPISMYLFHRLEEKFDGRLTGLFLDEGWQWLTQAYWREKLEEYLVTLRKANVLVFLSTQLPDRLAKSSIASALIQGTATNIYLPNPKADEKDYIHHFKLTAREYGLIKNFDPASRHFLFKQGNEAAVARINLNGMHDYLAVLSGNNTSVALCEAIRKKTGDDPADWLPLFYRGIAK